MTTWEVVDYKDGILTTNRDGGRCEDFAFRDDGLIEASKHYGDHEWESSGEATPRLPNGRYKLTGNIVVDLINAAIQFHDSLR